MLPTTRNAITALLRSDPSIPPRTIDAVLNALVTGCDIPPMDSRPIERVLSRQTVARLLGVSPHSVSIYARRGIIKPVCFGETAQRANGYSESSVRDALQRKRETEQRAAQRKREAQRRHFLCKRHNSTSSENVQDRQNGNQTTPPPGLGSEN